MTLPVNSKTPSIIKEYKNNEFYRLNSLGKKIVHLQQNNKHALAHLQAFCLIFETCLAILCQTVKLSLTAAGVASGIVVTPAVKLANRIVYLDKTTELQDIKVTISRVGRGDASSTRRKLARVLPKVLKSIPDVGNFISTTVKIVKLSLMIPLILTVGFVSPNGMLKILHKFKFISLRSLATQERVDAIIEQAKLEEGNSLNIERKNRLVTEIFDRDIASTKDKLFADGGELAKRLQAKLEQKRQKVRDTFKEEHKRDIDEDFAVLDLMLANKTYRRFVGQWLELEEKKMLIQELNEKKISLDTDLSQEETHATREEIKNYYKAVKQMIDAAGFGTKHEKPLTPQQINKILDRFDFSQEKKSKLECYAKDILTKSRSHHDLMFKNHFLKKLVQRSLRQEKALLNQLLKDEKIQKNAILSEQDINQIEEIVQQYFSAKEEIIEKTRVCEEDEANLKIESITELLNKYSIPENLKKDLEEFALDAVNKVKDYHLDMSMKGLLLTEDEYKDFFRCYYQWNLTDVEGGRLVDVEKDKVVVTQDFLAEFYSVSHPWRINERARIEFELVEARNTSLENRLINEWLSIEKGDYLTRSTNDLKDLKTEAKKVFKIKKLMVEAIRFAGTSQRAFIFSNELELKNYLKDEKEAVIAKILKKAEDENCSEELKDRRYASIDKMRDHLDLKMAIFNCLKMQDQNVLEFDVQSIENLLGKIDIPAEEKEKLKDFARDIKDLLQSELNKRKVDRQTVISHRQQYEIHQYAMKELKKVVPKRFDLQPETLDDIDPNYPNMLLQDERFAHLEQRQIRVMQEAKDMYVYASKAKAKILDNNNNLSNLDESQDQTFDIPLDNVQVPFNTQDPYSRWEGVQTNAKDEIVYRFMVGNKVDKEMTGQEIDDLIADRKLIAKEAAKKAKKNKHVFKEKYCGPHGINQRVSKEVTELAHQGVKDYTLLDYVVKDIERLEKQLELVNV